MSLTFGVDRLLPFALQNVWTREPLRPARLVEVARDVTTLGSTTVLCLSTVRRPFPFLAAKLNWRPSLLT